MFKTGFDEPALPGLAWQYNTIRIRSSAFCRREDYEDTVLMAMVNVDDSSLQADSQLMSAPAARR